MYRRKAGDYNAYSGELADQNIAYRPLIWSAFGRAHPETQTILRTMAVVAARRSGLRDHALILRRVRAAVGVQLATRAVRMLRACIPRLDSDEAQILLGCTGGEADPQQARTVSLIGGEADVLAPTQDIGLALPPRVADAIATLAPTTGQMPVEQEGDYTTAHTVANAGDGAPRLLLAEGRECGGTTEAATVWGPTPSLGAPARTQPASPTAVAAALAAALVSPAGTAIATAPGGSGDRARPGPAAALS